MFLLKLLCIGYLLSDKSVCFYRRSKRKIFCFHYFQKLNGKITPLFLWNTPTCYYKENVIVHAMLVMTAGMTFIRN